MSRILALVFGCGLLALTVRPPSGWAATGPFANFVGNWSGTGTVRPANGVAERIRCNANYRPRGTSQHEIGDFVRVQASIIERGNPMPPVRPERQRLDADHGIKIEVAVEMREQGAAARRLPFESGAKFGRVDPEQQ